MGQSRHITLPEGFIAAGVHCGIKTSGSEDLAVIASKSQASAALLTTSNQVVGAPVLRCRQVLPRGYGKIRGIVINSGMANVCTGQRGAADAEAMTVLTARLIGAKPDEILVASTGVIGHRLPMPKIRRGITAACRNLSRGDDGAVLRAIMTTDTKEKSAVVQTRIGSEKVTLAGIVKGAGMIAPSLATMISIITTDAKIAPSLLWRTLKAVAAETFNAVTVDSDQSTSDTIVTLASGLAGTKIQSGSSAHRKFAGALVEVCRKLAVAMARDGEGATKLIQITVKSAATKADAVAASKSVANSPLVKCAVHGADPNWGRIVMAVGNSTANVDPAKISVTIGDIKTYANGLPRNFSHRAVREHLKGDTVFIEVSLGMGREKFTAYTCDLSGAYVKINADYHT
ncbi:MAG: bifunctional glutamate N-acetyltransferase/amino-acid acetyltransferase ArgJ [Planctomycetota bacterium]|nr:bifunctional glutamate N-acetyltransferase/amino-acid acetyltransferase ArgJ [Planctomycetota bacterium]